MGTAKGFTVNPDGSITAASVEEALQLSDAMIARQQQKSPPPTPSALKFSKANGHSASQKFIQTLKPHAGQVLDSAQLAKIIGVDSPIGVGPKLRHLKVAFEHDNLSLSDYVEGSKNGKEPMVWQVKDF